MSIIGQQVKEILNMAGILHDEKRYAAEEIMRQAADTIEALSAKVAAANMEQSERYYNGGWISVDDRLPEENGWYLVYAKNQRPFVAYFKGKTFPLNNHYHEIVAWMHLPEPYRP